jgi:hypothetical protein
MNVNRQVAASPSQITVSSPSTSARNRPSAVSAARSARSSSSVRSRPGAPGRRSGPGPAPPPASAPRCLVWTSAARAADRSSRRRRPRSGRPRTASSCAVVRTPSSPTCARASGTGATRCESSTAGSRRRSWPAAWPPGRSAGCPAVRRRWPLRSCPAGRSRSSRRARSPTGRDHAAAPPPSPSGTTRPPRSADVATPP